MVHPRAGQPALPADLVDVPALISAYYAETPDAGVASELVAFGTSGHRGSSLRRSFNDLHIAAIAQAITEYRTEAGISGPLYLGTDTHALSTPAQITAIEVLVANGVDVRWSPDVTTPTPAVSRAVLQHNTDASARRADGVVITPSHNPPADGGFKYDPPHGGPAGGAITAAIQTRANALLASPADIQRMPIARARRSDHLHAFDFVTPYVDALAQVIDMDAIAAAKLRLGADPMGGSGIAYWGPIAERYGLDITVVNDAVDPTFRFMTLDHDGKIRMDCSSRHAMASLVALRDRFDVAFGNDTDFDRHGIVTPKHGLLNPNHYLAVAIDHLFRTRTWEGAEVGKTLVTSAIVDRVAAELDRPLHEVPVGFKHFVEGLRSGALGFGGEESAGASFLCRDGSVWTTDKDGILLDLLAAEITAVGGEDLGDRYAQLTARFGAPIYERTEAPATPEQKAKLKELGPEQVLATELAGDPITAKLTRAPGNGAAIGGLKVQTDHGWFAARPSGTEAVYKIYAESFRGEDHLRRIQDEAQAIVTAALS